MARGKAQLRIRCTREPLAKDELREGEAGACEALVVIPGNQVVATRRIAVADMRVEIDLGSSQSRGGDPASLRNPRTFARGVDDCCYPIVSSMSSDRVYTISRRTPRTACKRFAKFNDL
jgi:hypothetical protein